PGQPGRFESGRCSKRPGIVVAPLRHPNASVLGLRNGRDSCEATLFPCERTATSRQRIDLGFGAYPESSPRIRKQRPGAHLRNVPFGTHLMPARVVAERQSVLRSGPYPTVLVTREDENLGGRDILGLCIRRELAILDEPQSHRTKRDPET